MRPADLQLPDAAAQRAEATVGFKLPVALEVTRGTERQVHTLVEVLTSLTIAAMTSSVTTVARNARSSSWNAWSSSDSATS